MDSLALPAPSCVSIWSQFCQQALAELGERQRGKPGKRHLLFWRELKAFCRKRGEWIFLQSLAEVLIDSRLTENAVDRFPGHTVCSSQQMHQSQLQRYRRGQTGSFVCPTA